MKIKIRESNDYVLKSFIDKLVKTYWQEIITEEYLGPEDIVQPQRKYKNKQEAKDTLFQSFDKAVKTIELDTIVDHIETVESTEKGLSMYFNVVFDIENNVNDYEKFVETYGDLSEFEIRVSDHPYNKYTGFDKNIIITGKSINQILPKIQTYVTNRINRVNNAIADFNQNKQGE